MSDDLGKYREYRMSGGEISGMSGLSKTVSI